MRRQAGSVTAVPALALLCILLTTQARAGVIVETPETWTEAGLRGWADTATDVDLANSGNALLITFAAQGEPPVGSGDDTIFTHSDQATAMFVGNYTDAGVSGARFRFLASNEAPQKVFLAFKTGDREWRRPLSITKPIGQWGDYAVGFSYGNGWSTSGPGGSETDFLADLTAVNWIGIHIDRGSTAEQYYGLDDFELFVPEPSSILMLASALCGLLFAHRRRPVF